MKCYIDSLSTHDQSEIPESCEVCLKFKKTPARPVVSLPLAITFNEVVLLDLKEWVKNKTWFIYLIDAATLFTLAGVIYEILDSFWFWSTW